MPSPQKLVGPPELDELPSDDEMPSVLSVALVVVLAVPVSDPAELDPLPDEAEPEPPPSPHSGVGASATHPSLSATHTLQYTVAPPRWAHVASPS